MFLQACNLTCSHLPTEHSISSSTSMTAQFATPSCWLQLTHHLLAYLTPLSGLYTDTVYWWECCTHFIYSLFSSREL